MRMTKVEILREAITKIVPVLAARAIKVVQQGDRAYVEYNSRHEAVRVVLPNLPDDAHEALIIAVQGFIDHEVAHVLFTDAAVGAKAERTSANGMFRLLEDIQIESSMRREFAGSFRNLESTWRFVQERLLGPSYDKAVAAHASEKQMQELLIMCALRAWNKESPAVEFMADKWQHFEAYKKAVGDELLGQISGLRTTMDSFKLAVAIQNRVEEYQKRIEEEKKKREEKREREERRREEEEKKPATDDEPGEDGEGEESDEDDSGDDEAEKEAGKPKDEPGRDESDEDEGEPEGDDPETEDEDEEDGNEEDDGEPEAEDEAGEPEDDAGSDADEGDEDAPEAAEDEAEPVAGDDPASSDEDEAEDEGDEEAAPAPADEDGESDEGQDESEGSEEGDDTIPEGELDDPVELDPNNAKDFESLMNGFIKEKFNESLKATPYYPFSRELDIIERFVPVDSPRLSRDVAELDKEVSKMTGALQKKLERAIAAHSLTRHVPGYSSGKIHGPSLHRVATKSDKVFSRKFSTRTRDTAVQLVVDLSGSMAGSKVKLAMEAAFALSSVLDRMSITHEVIGFTTCPLRLGDKYRTLAEEAAKFIAVHGSNSISRLEPLYIPILKSFTERLTIDRKKAIVGVISQTDLYNNVDGESIEVCARRLKARTEARKIMIVLSDGSPNAGTGHYLECARHLKAVVKSLPAAGIDVFGIGIEDDSVNDYYPMHEVINHMEELPGRVITTMERLLFK